MASLDERLDAAIDRVLAGQLVSEPELQPLLILAAELREMRAPSATRSLASERMRAALAERSGAGARAHPLAGLWSWLARILRPNALIPAGLVALLLALLWLSNNALPGQTYYPVKRGSEAVRLLFTQDRDARTQYYTELAWRRLREMEQLVMAGEIPTTEMITRLQTTWELALTTAEGGDDTLRNAAAEQRPRLIALLPLLPPAAQVAGQHTLDLLTNLLNDEGPPTPVPPLPSSTPRATAIPTATSPAIATPEPTETPAPATSAPGGTPTAAETAAPKETGQPAATPRITADTPAPTATRQTATRQPTDTPVPPARPEPTETLAPTETEEPEETPEPRPTETEEADEAPGARSAPDRT